VLLSHLFVMEVQEKVIGMKEMKAIFENEDATRLLNLFICYKEVICKTENRNETSALDDLPLDAPEGESEFTIGVLPKPIELAIK
jgi:hypothetical protein